MTMESTGKPQNDQSELKINSTNMSTNIDQNWFHNIFYLVSFRISECVCIRDRCEIVCSRGNTDMNYVCPV